MTALHSLRSAPAYGCTRTPPEWSRALSSHASATADGLVPGSGASPPPPAGGLGLGSMGTALALLALRFDMEVAGGGWTALASLALQF